MRISEKEKEVLVSAILAPPAAIAPEIEFRFHALVARRLESFGDDEILEDCPSLRMEGKVRGFMNIQEAA